MRPAQKQQEKVEPKPIKIKPLTAEEQALAARIAKTDESWREPITEESMLDFSLARDQYELPPEAKVKREAKEFAFRWIAKTPERIDEVTSLPIPARWFLCNRTNTPFLEKHIDPVHGGVQRLDQILVFKPYRMFEAHQNAKMMLTAQKQEQGDLKNRHGIKEGGAEWLAGEQFKISGKDQIVNEDTLEFVESGDET